MKTLIFILLVTFSAALPVTLLADPPDPVYGEEEKEQHIPSKAELKEAASANQVLTGMPEYPDDSNLRKLKIRNSEISYYVDTSSISSSEKDNIVRLVTVKISPHGARTVNYEGFDCGYKRYKTYGYAGSEGPIKPYAEQPWKFVIDDAENDRYRGQLIDSYLCGYFAYAASREKILKRMNGLKPYNNR